MKQWIKDLKETMNFGTRRGDRTGTGTVSRFGVISRFDLREGFPLVTVKFTSFHAIKHELLWMLRGETDVEYLKRHRVSIWDEWVKPETAKVEPITVVEMLNRIKGCTEHTAETIVGRLTTFFIEVFKKEPMFVSTPNDVFDHDTRIQLVIPRPDPSETKIEVYRRQIDAMLNALIGAGIELDVLCERGGLPSYDNELPWKKRIQALCHGRDGTPALWPVNIVKGELGPVYGQQLVRWQPGIDPKKLSSVIDQLPSSRYDEIPQIIKEMTPEPINQIQYVVDLLRNDPESRRIYLSMWNVGELKDMALMPCHISCQFYSEENAANDGKRLLSAMVYMRSNDAGLGEPFNIAQYALLLSMIAHVTNHDVKELIMVRGDHHVYLNHLDELDNMVNTRQTLPLCNLWLNPDITDIFDFSGEDICIIDYQSHSAIKLPVAI